MAILPHNEVPNVYGEQSFKWLRLNLQVMHLIYCKSQVGAAIKMLHLKSCAAPLLGLNPICDMGLVIQDIIGLGTWVFHVKYIVVEPRPGKLTTSRGQLLFDEASIPFSHWTQYSRNDTSNESRYQSI
ncbi:uncharacterized protein LOC141724273 [Apium graveolens]|uniref:uncharacterized protein LOC141724273 n=1 Tax=Apium graveolens TaxID=4045 RepID=UPI003D796E79